MSATGQIPTRNWHRETTPWLRPLEGFVGNALDDAKISPLHVKVVALIAAGYFFDVIDLIVLGSLIPDMLASKFGTGPELAFVGAATVFGMFIGAAGQGEFSDRWGRKTVYQFNLLVFGVFTILGALAPSVFWLMVCRFIAGLGLGGEQPLAFAYAGEYAPKAIRGRILAIVHFIGGACVWPIASLFTLFFRDQIGWRGVWIVIGIGALIVWVFRFALPESPRYLATHGRGKEALDVLARLGIAGPKEQLATSVASDNKSDPFRGRVQNVPEPRHRRHDLLLCVLWRRDRSGHMAAQHHDREGLHDHKIAHLHLRHDAGGAVREPVHDVRARQIRA